MSQNIQHTGLNEVQIGLFFVYLFKKKTTYVSH
jgi:hypothetical protein